MCNVHLSGRERLWLSCFLVTILLGLPLAVVPSARAASKFWDGSVNGNFSTAGNWVGGVAPVAGDDLVFQTGVPRLLVTNNFSPNRAFNSILFQGSNYFVRGNALLVTNGINSINPVGPIRDADVDVRASQAWEAQGRWHRSTSTATSPGQQHADGARQYGDFFLGGIISGAAIS
jgi:hypothetical protein